jgi:hypothetical protein
MPDASQVYRTGQKLRRTEVVELEHPDREEVVKTLQFCADCHTGGGGFGQQLQRLDVAGNAIDPFNPQSASSGYADIADRTYLVRYGREAEGKFISRTHQAYMPPYAKLRVLQPLTGFLTRNPPDRDSYPDFLNPWLDAATVDGLSLDEFLRTEGIPWGLTYPAVKGYPGGLPVVVDSDQHEAETEADRLAQGAEGPQLRTIHPDRLLDWGVDEEGKLEWIKYETILDVAHPVDGHSEITRIRWITPDGWWYVDLTDENKSDQEVEVVDGDVWPDNFTRAPIATIGFLRGEGIILSIAPLLHRLFNALSEKTEGERAGCFSILAYPSTKEVDALTLGTMNALPYDPESRGVPQFLTPDMAPLEHLETTANNLIQQVQEIGGTASIFGAGAEAAATMAYRFQTTSRFLDSLAADMAKSEYDILECVAMWEGQDLPDDMEAVQNLQFDAVDVERFIAEQVEARDGGFLTPTAKKVQSQKVIEVFDLWGDSEDREKIEDELDEMVEEEKNPLPIPGMPGAEGEDGQPPPFGKGPVPPPQAPPVPDQKGAVG